MTVKQIRRGSYFLGILALLLPMPSPVFADTSSSTNYRVDQTFFGTGGEIDASSTTYKAKQTAGETGVGITESTNYRALAGFNTTDDPFIEFVVTSSSIDLDYLDTATTKSSTGTFYVRAWQSYGYAVRTVSDPPETDSGYQLTALASPTAVATNTEQFGINLVDNATPNIGANPQQVPDSSFSFGSAATGYDTADQFKYVKGDIIAESLESTSVTTYTVSYIFNITDQTPSGRYVFSHDMVATGTY